VKYEEFWRGIILRFPRYSENRKYIEALNNGNHEVVGKIYDISVRFGLSALQVCEALDEEGIWRTNGSPDIERFRMVALQISEINKKDEAAARRLYHVPLNTAEGFTTQRALEVPERFKRDQVNYETLILESPIREILETLLDDEFMHDVYTHLFDKFEINYRLPNAVIRAMIHFMFVHNRAWSIAYLETIATDLLTKGIKTFEQAMDHFAERISWDEKHQSRSKRSKPKRMEQHKTKRPEKRINQIKTISSEKTDPVTDEELEDLIRRAKELN
jgi:replication initiation and membrane attachment protein DnaB